MKKLGLLIVLAAISCLGINATSASAATNCTSVTAGNVWYDGYWRWYANADGCTDVNAVQFEGAGTTPGITDLTRGVWHPSITGGGTPQSPYYPAPFGSYYTMYTNTIWGSGCGAPAFYVSKTFRYRLHNSTLNTWGSWHAVTGGNQYLC